MQKLAGILTESQFKIKLTENQEVFTVIDKQLPMKPISGTKEEILKYFSSKPDMAGVKITPDGKAIDVEDNYLISDNGLEWIWSELNSDEGLGGTYVIQKSSINEVTDNYGEIQAAESELEGALETGDYTEEEYLNELINASDEDLMDFQGGYYDIAKILDDLNEEEKQEAIKNIKNWATNQI
jgi:hypothetical protein